MKFKNWTILLFSILLFTSCFEVTEDLTFNKDMSGTFKLTLNLSKNKTQVSNFLALDSLRGNKIPSVADIDRSIDILVEDIKEISGVSNISSTKNFNDFILAIKFDFDKVSTLNTVIQHIAAKHAKNQPDLAKTNFFTYNNGVFKRESEFDYTSLLTKLKNEPKLIETSTYTCIYRFDGNVTSSNLAAKISPSGQAVMLKLRAHNLLKNHTLVENTITIKP